MFLSIAETHPLIDAAGTATHCWCFWHDRCTAPSIWCSGTGDENTAEQFQSVGAVRPVSVPPTPAASRETDGTGKALTECQDTSCFFTSLPVKQPEEFTTTSVTNNDKGTATTADSDSSTAVFYTTSHPLCLIVTYACCCCSGSQACMKWCALNMKEGQTQLNCFCDEYWLHFPWNNNSLGVRGSPFLLLLCFRIAVCAAPPLVCVRTPREGCRHDGPLSPYVHAVEPCVPLLFASPSSICVLVLRQGCVCACCRGLECVSCVVCGVRCMPGCCPLLMWCALCVCVCRTSRLPCCSPFPSLCRSAPHH
ncbi:trans-sialidase [Trypanosoma cruzi]|nr:trans-sialidase [Trypanosoma cruzi]